MKPWLGLLLAVACAAEESCMDRCENGFSANHTCQCDSMCKYYTSCCFDYNIVCIKARGDTFVIAEDDDEFIEQTPNTGQTTHTTPETQPEFSRTSKSQATATQEHPVTRTIPLKGPAESKAPTPRVRSTLGAPIGTTASASTRNADTTTLAPDPDAEVCSGRPFDSFMQLKNGSIFAFRGAYVFELDQRSVVPGYPKLIKDMWNISGPIDAAFTRVNCQGKTYIFKGNRYWRYEDSVLEEGYPREISVGFENIPDNVDAAFALPAAGHHGKEKVYFLTGDQYYLYEFLHQPSHGECVTLSERSLSTLFRRYTDLYTHNHYEQYFSELFSDTPRQHGGHHFITKDWKGLTSPITAALAGRMYVAPRSSAASRGDRRQQDQQYQQYGQWYDQQRKQYDQQYDHQRQQYDQHRQQYEHQRQQYDQRYDQQRQQYEHQRQQYDQRYDQQRQQYEHQRQQYEHQRQQYDQRYDQQRQQYDQQYDQQYQQQQEQQSGRGRQKRSPLWEYMAERGTSVGHGFAERERGMELGLRLAEKRVAMEERLGREWDQDRDRRDREWDQDWDRGQRRDGYRRYDDGNHDSRYNLRRDGRASWEMIRGGQPIQSVYFFTGDKYYRVDVKTKSVDPATPPYPRSIAKYWLGCSQPTGPEKK